MGYTKEGKSLREAMLNNWRQRVKHTRRMNIRREWSALSEEQRAGVQAYLAQRQELANEVAAQNTPAEAAAMITVLEDDEKLYASLEQKIADIQAQFSEMATKYKVKEQPKPMPDEDLAIMVDPTGTVTRIGEKKEAPAWGKKGACASAQNANKRW